MEIASHRVLSKALSFLMIVLTTCPASAGSVNITVGPTEQVPAKEITTNATTAPVGPEFGACTASWQNNKVSIDKAMDEADLAAASADQANAAAASAVARASAANAVTSKNAGIEATALNNKAVIALTECQQKVNDAKNVLGEANRTAITQAQAPGVAGTPAYAGCKKLISTDIPALNTTLDNKFQSCVKKQAETKSSGISMMTVLGYGAAILGGVGVGYLIGHNNGKKGKSDKTTASTNCPTDQVKDAYNNCVPVAASDTTSVATVPVTDTTSTTTTTGSATVGKAQNLSGTSGSLSTGTGTNAASSGTRGGSSGVAATTASGTGSTGTLGVTGDNASSTGGRTIASLTGGGSNAGGSGGYGASLGNPEGLNAADAATSKNYVDRDDDQKIQVTVNGKAVWMTKKEALKCQKLKTCASRIAKIKADPLLQSTR